MTKQTAITTKIIILSNGKEVLVDSDDYLELSKYSWGQVGKNYCYAGRGTRKKGQPYKKILMHRAIMNAPADMLVDHINGNTLDNRKSNLRITDKPGNLRNSKVRADSQSIYKGVSKKVSKLGTVRYVARIQVSKNKRLFLGYFKDELEAAKVYNQAAVKFFKQFAKLNKI